MSPRRLIFLLFFLSGSLGLLYEVVWLRLLILVFGSTQLAVTTVLAAFMGGLAAGAYGLGRIADRVRSPARLYGMLEIGVGLYALGVPWLFERLSPLARALAGAAEPGFAGLSAIRFLLALGVMALPTALMGGTLPALSRLAAVRREEIGLSVGSLYALNTAGAVAGTVAAGFVLLPAFGTRATLLGAAALNLAIGLAALAASRAMGAAPPGPSPPPARRPSRRFLLTLAASGAIAMLYEIAWTRVLALLLGSSVYAFATMLAVFLAGLAGGAAIASRRADRLDAGGLTRAIAGLLACAALSGYVTQALFAELPWLFARLYHAGEAAASPAALFALQFLICAGVMLPTTLLLGGVFPLALRGGATGVESLGRSVGAAFTASTLGTIAGSVLCGFVLIPWLGIRDSLLAAMAAGLVLAAALLAATGRGWPLALGGAACLAAAGLWAAAPGWDTLLMNGGVYQYVDDLGAAGLTRERVRAFMEGDQDLLFYEDGLTTSVMVTREKSTGAVLLAVNGKIDASSHGDLPTQILSAHLPLALSPRPRSVLVIGFASGITVGSALRHDVEQVTAVELEPAILRASRHFDEFNHRPLQDPRLRLARDDGRNHLLTHDLRHDVIISEPSNPWMTVASNLFTREFFELGRERLAPGGIFAQWVQIYGMGPAEVKALVRTFHAVFPHVLVFNTIQDADLVLIGAASPLGFDLPAIAVRLGRPKVAGDLARLGAANPQDLLSYFVFGDRELSGFLGPEGPLNTDDNALIEFAAPRSLHRSTRAINQAEVLRATVDPTAYVMAGLDGREAARLHHLRLAEAFVRRRQLARARAALAGSPGVELTDAGLRLLGLIDSGERGK